jgi:hypothetical protein
MKGGTLIISLLIAASLALLTSVLVQERHLASMRKEQQRMIAQLSGSAEPVPAVAAAEPAAGPSIQETPAELLQLRNEVNGLNRRKRELAAARAENDRLKQQLTTSHTNRAGLAPGYIRKSEARMAGYQTPEATLQTFLWAMQNRNLTNLLETLTPEAALQINKPFAHSSPERIFEGSEALIGLGVVEREPLPDGSVRMKLQVIPDVPPITATLRLIGNEWKMSWPPQNE